ncbi:MAG: tail assembly chaperone [Paenisporosarcina sp.]|nr:tail assembly chaperone [Paenisporosarcina sp.]
MARLTVKEKEYEGKCTFKFDRLADEKYGEPDKNGKNIGGFMNLYMALLQYSNNHLVSFWDCALDYLGKEKPSISEIEEAVEERLENDSDPKTIFQEAFKAVDDSGFFKLQAKTFWKNLELMKDKGETEEEKAENLKMYNMLQDSLKEMKE